MDSTASQQRSALGDRNFLIYFLGAGFSLHGTWIQRIAQGWLAWKLTGSEAWVGIVAFLDFFPVAVLAPAFGVVADRVDRKNMMILANALMMLNIAALTVCMILGLVDIWLLVLFVMIQGTLNAMNTPARLSLVPNLVSIRRITSALSLMALMFNVSRFIGPALAGMIIELWGVTGAFAINTLSFLVFALALNLLTAGSNRSGGQRKQPFLELYEGVQYALRRPSIIWSLVLIMVMGFFARGAMELMPAFSDVFFGQGSNGLAALTSAAGAGAIFGALALASERGLSTLFKWVIAAAVLASIILTGFGLNRNFIVGLALMSMMGFCVTLVGVGIQIIIQARVHDDYRGRVMSIWASLGFGAVATGGLALGSLAEPFGLGGTTWVAGICCLVAILGIAKPMLARAKAIDRELGVEQSG